MSPIGRIFSVINLVLAALFLGWASVNLATSQEWKTKQLATQTALEALEVDLAEQTRALRSERDTKSEALSQMTNDRDNQAAAAARTADELKAKERENSDLRASLATLSNAQQSLQEQLATQTQLASQAQAAQADAETARDAALRAQQDAETERATVVADNEGLNKQISDMLIQLNASGETISSLEVQLASLQQYTGASLSDILAQPFIHGTVVQALYDVQPGLVAINKGKNDGVMRGFTFEISKGTQYKGQVRVENVRDDMCTCIVLRTEPGQQIEQGDRADTKL